MGKVKEFIVEFAEDLNKDFGLVLEVDDWFNDYHSTVRDWVENGVFVEPDDLSPNEMEAIEKRLLTFESILN